MSQKIVKSYFPEIFRNKFGHKKPVSVSLNITSKCNQKCIYCEIGCNILGSRKDLLSFKDIRWIIDEMEKNKIERLSINGGEPFLFNNIIEVVEYAGNKGIQCAITSNGMNFHELSSNDIYVLKRFKAEVNISIDSFNHDINFKTRRVENATVNAIKSIEKLINNGFEVIVLTAISKYNFEDLYKSFLKAYELGVSQVLYQPIIFESNYPDRKKLNDKASLNVSELDIPNLMSELKKIKKFEYRHQIKTNVYRISLWIKEYLKLVENNNSKMFFEKVLKHFRCRDIHAMIDITYDGTIQPCALVTSNVNIKDLEVGGLITAWHTAGKWVKEKLDKGEYIKECNSCCNHFSRNMFASVMAKPLSNIRVLIKILIVFIERAVFLLYKKFLPTRI